MEKKYFNRALVAACCTAIMAVLVSACSPSGAKKSVDTCSTHNNDKILCQGSIDKDGKNCQYDDQTKTCSPEIITPPDVCKDLDETKCKNSKDCTFDKVTDKCEDAAVGIKGKCEAIQAAQACKDDTTCTWDASVTPNVCKTTGQTGLNKYFLYEFGEVDPTKIQAAADKIHSAVASGKGFVYVAGRQADDTGVMDRSGDDGATWEAVGLKGTYVDATGKNANAFFDLKKANAPIDIVGSLHHGVIISEPKSFLIGLIEDADKTKVSKSWAFTTAKIGSNDRRPSSFFEVQKGNTYFVYAGNLEVKDGISYYQTDPAPIYTAWKTGYSEDGDPTHDLKQAFTMFAHRPGGGMFLGSKDGEVYEMDATAIGDVAVNEKKLKNANPKIEASYLRHGVNKNSDITCMLLVEDKYLLVGFEGTATQGGLFYGDITVADPKDGNWQHTGPKITITGMVVDSNEPARAVVATDQGVMIFYKGVIQEIVPGEKLITTALVAAHKGDISDKATAKTGFLGALRNDKLKGVAQGKNIFFLPSRDNVQQLKILSKDF